MSRVICCEDRRYRYCESEDGRYRYWLEAKLEDRNGVCLFLMLNPATENADQERKRSHRTTRNKCEEYSQRWGYGTLWTCNLFALRSKDPKKLKEVAKPEEAIGAENNLHIVQKAHRSDMIVCAWGNKGKYYGRGREVTEILKNEGLLCKMHYLAMTGKCQPMHPLFIKRDALPKPFVDAPAYFQCN